MSSSKKAVIGIVVVASVLVLIDKGSLPGRNRFLQSLNNAGHVPMFGVLSIALLHLVRRVWRGCPTYPLACYFVTFALSTGLGVFSEFLQIAGPRDADLTDLFRNMTGAATFLALHSTFDRQAKVIWRRWPYSYRTLVGIGAALVLIVSVSPSAYWGIAYWKQSRDVPVLCDFRSFWSTRFVRASDVQFRWGVTDRGTGDNDKPVAGGELSFRSGEQPGISIVDVYPDWRGYDSLIIVVEVGTDAPPFLALSVDDYGCSHMHTDLFAARFPLQRGSNHLAVPLDSVRVAPSSREMRMERMRKIHIYGDSTFSGSRVLVQEVRLK